jgi:hypothetical protein
MAGDVEAKFYLVLLKELQAITDRREDTPSDAGPFSDDPSDPLSEQRVWERVQAAARIARERKMTGFLPRTWDDLDDEQKRQVRKEEETRLREVWQQEWDRAEEAAVERAVAASAAKYREKERYRVLAKAQKQAEAAHREMAHLFHTRARAEGRNLNEMEAVALKHLRQKLELEVQRAADARNIVETSPRKAGPREVAQAHAQAEAAHRKISDLLHRQAQAAGRELTDDEKRCLVQLKRRYDAEVEEIKAEEVRDWEEKKRKRLELKKQRDKAVEEAIDLHQHPSRLSDDDEIGQKEVEKREEKLLQKAEEQALNMDLVGLAFSGGGIRSATFNLGILQGLASLGLLKRFDYLSTVSGGGYIGSWLAAWIKREGGIRHVEQQMHENRWEQAKGRVPEPGADGRDREGRPIVFEEEPEAIFHLRSYSNYLAPRPGFFSADTWVGASIYLRNLLLNQLLLLPVVVAILLVARLGIVFYYWDGNASEWTEDSSGVVGFLRDLARFAPVHFVLLLVVAGALIWASYWIFRSLSRLRWSPASRASKSLQFSVGILHVTILGALLLASFLFCWFAWDNPDPNDWKWYHVPKDFDSCYKRAAAAFAVILGVFFGVLHVFWAFLYWFLARWRKAATLGGAPLKWWWIPLGGLAGLASGAAGGALLGVLFQLANDLLEAGTMAEETLETAAMLTLGPPLVLLVYMLGTFAQVGSFGRILGEDAREWWASLCGRLLMLALGWAAVFAVALFSVPFLYWAGQWVQAALGAGWVATAVGGVLAGRSPRTDGNQPNRPLEILALVAPYVFLVGLLAAMSFVVSAWVDTAPSEEAVAQKPPLKKTPLQPPTKVRTVTKGGQGLPVETRTQEYLEQRDEREIASRRYWVGILNMQKNATAEQVNGTNKAECWPLFLHLAKWLAGCVIVWLFASWCVDVNVFSMHGTYGNRLVRCYLGASRVKEEKKTDRPPGVRPNSALPRRQPDPITGFDLDDDFPLHDLVIGPAVPFGGRIDLPSRRRPYWGPYLLVNTAMNLLEGDELAWQERKAESFVLTAVHCGSKGTGYRPLPEYGDNLKLGTAVTVSGAAASPNMGYHSSPAVTALLTIFNVRLGAWFGNPKQRKWQNQGPLMSGFQLLNELFGRTNRRSEYVYLSDGGHFENLGVYELVRRRCRYIVAVDADQDGRYAFDDLGGLIRKCRNDLGVPIDIDVTPIRPRGTDGRSLWHCAIGKIRYDSVHPEALPGTLVYLKTSLNGDEPSDVLNYASQHPDFPHQTTANQFFTESQFESYRALGYHVVREVFWDAMRDVDTTAEMSTEAHRRVITRLFANLHRHWFPPPPQLEEVFLESVKSYIDMQAAFRTDRNLRDYSRGLYPEVSDNGAPAGVRADRRISELHATNQMLQAMENAWLSVRLEGFYAHPLNRGWMNVFRRWSSSEVFRRHWLILRGEFSWDFVRFCEKELRLDPGKPRAIRTDPTMPRGDPAWQALENEFAREWPIVHAAQDARDNSLDYLIRQARDLRLVIPTEEGGGRDLPAIWLVTLALTTDPPVFEWTGDHYPCGIVLVWKPPDSTTDYELVVWLRGAYRNLGIGRACLEDLFPKIISGLQLLPRRREKVRVRFPSAGRLGGTNTMQMHMWLRFYNRHGVRRRVPGRVPSEDLILEYKIPTEEIVPGQRFPGR